MKTKVLGSSLAMLMAISTAAQAQDYVSIRYPDGRPDIIGIEKANEILHTIGVHISTVNIPTKARPILKKSESQALSEADKENLLSYFKLSQKQLLEQIKLAGREPTVAGGGVLTRDKDGHTYPNVDDMQSADDSIRKLILEKYGRLHVNSADDGTGIDEVMTVVSGGPYRWGFTLNDGTVIRFQVNKIGGKDKAVRVSYAGLGMHAGIIDAKHGVMISYAHGPEEFVMRYDSPKTPYAQLLGTNQWIDYSEDMPKVLDCISPCK